MAISGIANLERSLRQFGERASDTTVLARQVTLDLFEQIVTRTPVDTGRARGNWQIGINAPVQTEIDLGLATRQGDVADLAAVDTGQMGAAVAALAGIKPGDIPFISNPVPYVPYLETGHSTQAPNGMVAISADEIRRRYPGVEINGI